MKQNHIYRKIGMVVCFLMCLSIATVTFAASAPQEVLDARAGVARIICEYPGEDEGAVVGSGFAVGDSDYVDFIVTNYHVIEGDPYEITVITDSNLQTKATVYAELPTSDLAILQLNEPISELRPLRINTKEMETNIGAEVYALGFPAAADYVFDEADTFSEQVSITSGIVSSVKPVSWLTDSPKSVQAYQIDVPISGGNSGGPLLNDKGEIIGITSFGVGPEGKALLSAENINGAISSLELKYFLDDQEIAYYHDTAFPVWIPITIIVAAAVAVTILLLWMRRKKRSTETMKKQGKGKWIALNSYLETVYTPFVFEHAVRILAPIAYQLAQMHTQMQWYGNVSLDNILIDPKTGLTQLKEQQATAQAGGNMVISPGYSPLEKYRADIADGGYTDVFGFAAVLYRLLFRADPPEIFARMQNDQTIVNQINSLPIYDQNKQAFLKCLNPDPRERYQNAGEMITALSIAPPVVQQAETIPQNAPVGMEAVQKKKKRRKKLLWLIPIGVAAAAAIVCGVLFTQNAGVIQAAQKLMEQERYAQAKQKYETAYFLSEADKGSYAIAQAGAAFQDEKYEKALEYMESASQSEQADQLKKDIVVAYSMQMYYDDKTEEALELLKPYEGDKEVDKQIVNIICLEADWQFQENEDEVGYEWLKRLNDTPDARDAIKYWAQEWTNAWYTEAGDYDKTIGILQNIPFQDEKQVQKSIEEVVLREVAYAVENMDYERVSELMTLMEGNEKYAGLSDSYKAIALYVEGEFGEARVILKKLIDEGMEDAEGVLKEINDADLLYELITGTWYSPAYFYVWDDDGWVTSIPLASEATYQRIEDGNLRFVNDNNEPVVIYEIWKLTEDELVLKSESGEFYEFESVS